MNKLSFWGELFLLWTDVDDMHIITLLLPISGVTAVVSICLTLLAMCSLVHNCSFVFCALWDSTPTLAHNVIFSSCHRAKPFLTFSLLPWL